MIFFKIKIYQANLFPHIYLKQHFIPTNNLNLRACHGWSKCNGLYFWFLGQTYVNITRKYRVPCLAGHHKELDSHWAGHQRTRLHCWQDTREPDSTVNWQDTTKNQTRTGQDTVESRNCLQVMMELVG